jgi:hypothetical protein
LRAIVNLRSYRELRQTYYSWRMIKTILRILTVLWALCIAICSIIRGYRFGAMLQTMGVAHVAAHFGVFAVLGILVMLSFDTPGIRLLGVCLGIALGFTTELYEHLAFHGPMEYGDVLIDALGVLVGAAALLVKNAIRPRARVL